MLDLTLLVVVVVVVISGGTAMFFYTSFQKGLIIFYSLGQEFCLFFFFLSNKVQMEFRSVINQKKKSEMVISLRWAHLCLRKAGQVHGVHCATAHECALTSKDGCLWDKFYFSGSLEMNTSEISPSGFLLNFWSYYPKVFKGIPLKSKAVNLVTSQHKKNVHNKNHVTIKKTNT